MNRRIVLALPLGIGKPNVFVNEIYRRAVRDPGIDLTILTALSLSKPRARGDLERRFIEPLVQRVFGNYPELDYVAALHSNSLPSNIRIVEFFLEPGAYLDVPHSQQNHLSANYTHVVRDLMALGVNVIAHLIAKRSDNEQDPLSFGSNPDITVDLLPVVDEARQAGRDIVLIGQVSRQMPFMLDRALIARDRFDYLIDNERDDYDLFCPPNPALASVDHAIGLHASALVRDGGTLQIGIGELGDAIVYSLLLRHQQNAAYREALQALGTERASSLIDAEGGREPFAQGLFASTEMFVDQILDLYRAGILSRRVHDCLPVQKLLARGRVSNRFDATILERLVDVGVGPCLSAQEFLDLQRCGVFRRDVKFADGRLCAPDGEWIRADLGDPQLRARLSELLGRELQNGQVLHAGFFLGPRGFYAALRDLNDADRAQFAMRGVGFINQLYGPEQELKILQRQHARFMNTAMMVTLLGAAVSDGLEDGRVVSGVGGQYNFVSMAHALPGARSVLCVRATRSKRGRVTSNIVWNYGHTTIPRHLRDIVITEYGIADLRGRSDHEIIAALLNIVDSRFQEPLLSQAKAAGKIRSDYQIPDAYRHNTPERLESALAPHRQAGLFSEYPFGTDLTAEEVVLARALKHLKSATATRMGTLKTFAQALLAKRAEHHHEIYLRRLALEAPRHFGDRVLRRLVTLALRQSSSPIR